MKCHESMNCHDLSLKKPRSTSEGLKLRIGENIRCWVFCFRERPPQQSKQIQQNAEAFWTSKHPPPVIPYISQKETTSLRVWQFSKGLYDLGKSKISFYLISLPNPKDQAWALFLLAVQGYNTIARFHHVGLLPGTNCFRTWTDFPRFGFKNCERNNIKHLRKNETTKNDKNCWKFQRWYQ